MIERQSQRMRVNKTALFTVNRRIADGIENDLLNEANHERHIRVDIIAYNYNESTDNIITLQPCMCYNTPYVLLFKYH